MFDKSMAKFYSNRSTIAMSVNCAKNDVVVNLPIKAHGYVKSGNQHIFINHLIIPKLIFIVAYTIVNKSAQLHFYIWIESLNESKPGHSNFHGWRVLLSATATMLTTSQRECSAPPFCSACPSRKHPDLRTDTRVLRESDRVIHACTRTSMLGTLMRLKFFKFTTFQDYSQ